MGNDKQSKEHGRRSEQEPFTILLFNPCAACGKTTTAAHLAAALALDGKRTVLMDLDPMAELTRWFLPEFQRSASPSSAPKLPQDETDVGASVVELPHRLDGHLAVLPNPGVVNRLQSAGMNSEEYSLGGQMQAEQQRLRAILHSLKGRAEFVIIDSPPMLTTETAAAMQAAHLTITPFNPDESGESQIVLTVNDFRRTARLLGCRARPLSALQYRPEVALSAGDAACRVGVEHAFNTVISPSPLFPLARAEGLTVLEYAPEASCSDEFRELSVEVQRLRNDGLP